MSKAKKQQLKKSRFLIELDHGRKILLLKRGRLLRTGEFIEVQKLNDFPRPAKAWLRSVVAHAPNETVGHLWDQAHSLAARIKNDLGELVYVEPEINSGQTGLYKTLISVYGSATSSDDEEKEGEHDHTESLSDLDPRSLIPDPMKHIKASMPDNLLPSVGQHSLKGFGGNNGQAPELPSMAGERNPGSPSKTKRKVHVLGTLEERLERHFRNRFIFPLMYELPRWSELPAATKRMLEIEMVQVYRGAKLRAQYPRLESEKAKALPEQERIEILNTLFALPMSRALRRLNEMQRLAA